MQIVVARKAKVGQQGTSSTTKHCRQLTGSTNGSSFGMMSVTNDYSCVTSARMTRFQIEIFFAVDLKQKNHFLAQKPNLSMLSTKIHLLTQNKFGAGTTEVKKGFALSLI